MIADIKGILWALVFVMLMYIWLMSGCTSRIDKWREYRQEQQEQRQQRWDDWQQDRREKWHRGRWRDRQQSDT